MRSDLDARSYTEERLDREGCSSHDKFCKKGLDSYGYRLHNMDRYVVAHEASTVGVG
jgi:hypothetical protein